jgi:hypothetical protein
MSVIVIGGAIVNAVIAHRYDHQFIKFLQRHPERRSEPQTL